MLIIIDIIVIIIIIIIIISIIVSPDQLIIIKCLSSAMVFTSQMRSEQKWACLFSNMQVLKINHIAHQN